MTENTFCSISWLTDLLQKRNIPHFKGNFLINNFFACPKRAECVLEALQLKMLVQIIFSHPSNFRFGVPICFFWTSKYEIGTPK